MYVGLVFVLLYTAVFCKLMYALHYLYYLYYYYLSIFIIQYVKVDAKWQGFIIAGTLCFKGY